MRWLPLLFIALFSELLFAGNIRGKVQIQGDHLFLQLHTEGQQIEGPTYRLSASSPLLRSLISYLDVDDYIDGDGRIDHDEQKVILGSINSLGLSRLLGTWKSDSQDIYQFNSFSSLELKYNPDALIVPAPQLFHYRITPKEPGIWTILFVGQNIQVGTLYFDDTNSIIQLIDDNTGSIIRTLRLSR